MDGQVKIMVPYRCPSVFRIRIRIRRSRMFWVSGSAYLVTVTVTDPDADPLVTSTDPDVDPAPDLPFSPFSYKSVHRTEIIVVAK